MRTQNLKKNYKTIIGVSLLAFLLWFMVKMNKVYEYSMNIPIQYENIPENLIFKQPESKTVRVEFDGRGIDLLRLHFYNLRYRIDLSNSGKYMELNLSEHPEYVNFPGELNVEVKSVTRPRILDIDLDEKVTKKLPVDVTYDLQTPPGYIQVAVIKKPDSVQVTGPAVMFRNVETLMTTRAEFSDVKRAFTETFPINKLKNYYAEYNPPQIEVTFDIQRLAEKEILNVQVEVVDSPKDVQVIPLPSTANIYVKGGEKLLADLTADDFRIIIDFKKAWHPGVKKIKADLVTDVNLLHMETRPPEFELIVQKTQKGEG